MNIKQIIENHYSTKAFDPAKKIAVEDFELIKAPLQGSPSSFNIQPQHFVIADNETGKIPINQGWSITKEWIELFCINLMIISLFEGLCFKECVQHAYDQIKDRKGKMIDGMFVKEEDL